METPIYVDRSENCLKTLETNLDMHFMTQQFYFCVLRDIWMSTYRAENNPNGEWVDKLQYSYTKECYTVGKMNYSYIHDMHHRNTKFNKK